MEKVKIQNNLHLERDMTSQAIINNNNTAYHQRLSQIARNKKKENEIAEIKSELAEIKELLKNLGGN